MKKGTQFTDRETARERLTTKLAGQRKILADFEKYPPGDHRRPFTYIDPQFLIDDAEFRLRWIDCAPEGANHITAPLQDKDGVPCGGNVREDVGPGKALRAAYAKRGKSWIERKLEAAKLQALIDSTECPDCGAQPGEWCRPEYGCRYEQRQQVA